MVLIYLDVVNHCRLDHTNLKSYRPTKEGSIGTIYDPFSFTFCSVRYYEHNVATPTNEKGKTTNKSIRTIQCSIKLTP